MSTTTTIAGVLAVAIVGALVVLFAPKIQLRFALGNKARRRGPQREMQGQTVVITIESPTGEFDKFLPKAIRVLDAVEWQAEK